jgi:hypothetical protein
MVWIPFPGGNFPLYRILTGKQTKGYQQIVKKAQNISPRRHEGHEEKTEAPPPHLTTENTEHTETSFGENTFRDFRG